MNTMDCANAYCGAIAGAVSAADLGKISKFIISNFAVNQAKIRKKI